VQVDVRTTSHQWMAALIATSTQSNIDVLILTPIHVHYVVGVGESVCN